MQHGAFGRVNTHCLEKNDLDPIHQAATHANALDVLVALNAFIDLRAPSH
jgi:hypothetical protein